MALWGNVRDRLFGYDVFVSFARSDGLNYAHRLVDYLVRIGWTCVLDATLSTPSSTIPRANRLSRLLKNGAGTVLVFVPVASLKGRITRPG